MVVAQVATVRAPDVLSGSSVVCVAPGITIHVLGWGGQRRRRTATSSSVLSVLL